MAVMTTCFTIGFGGCQKPDSAETAGKKIDQAAEKAGEKAEQAAEKASEKAGQASQKITEQSRKTGTAIDDTVVTAKVKAAIFAEPGLKTLQINVATADGVVTLTGSVDSQAGKDRTAEIAGAVAGVNRVENRLVVKTPK